MAPSGSVESLAPFAPARATPRAISWRRVQGRWELVGGGGRREVARVVGGGGGEGSRWELVVAAGARRR